MSRAGGKTRAPGAKLKQSQPPPPPMDLNHISDNLKAGLAELDVLPIQSKTDSSTLLAKILKDKEQREVVEKEAQRAQELRDKGHDSEEDEEAQAAAAAEHRARQTEQAKRDMESRKQAAAGPPIFAQVLFPVEVPSETCQLSEDLDIVRACSEISKDESEEISPTVLTKELIVGGWLQEHYLRVGEMPFGCQQILLLLATASPDTTVSHQAFLTLNSVLSTKPNKQSGLYSRSAAKKVSKCGLTDADFKEAFKRLGVADSSAKNGKAQEAEPVKRSHDSDDEDAPPEISDWSDASRPPSFQHLQHTIVLLNTAAAAQAEGLSDSLTGAGSVQLLVTLLQLRLDPAACMLNTELEDAALSVINCVSESEWSLKFATTVSQIVAIGASFRGVLETLRYLSQQDSPRAQALCSHSAAQLIPTLLLIEGAQPPKAKKSRGSEEVNPEDVVRNLKWYNKTTGVQLMNKALRHGTASPWEVRGVMELMDLLLWPHIQASHCTGKPPKFEKFINEWDAFCQKVAKNTRKDEDGMAIKLLATTISTRNEGVTGMS